MTAGDRNFIRGEVHRNERAPRWGVAKIEEAEKNRKLCGLLNTTDGSVCKGVQPGKPDAEMITPAAAQCSHLNETAAIFIEDGFIRFCRQLQRVPERPKNGRGDRDLLNK